MFKIILFIFISVRVILGQWQIIGQMPHPVAGAEAVTDGENIYLLGGYSDSTQSAVNWIQVYNTVNKSWSFSSTMKSHRNGLIASMSGNSIYYFGGVTDTTDSANIIEKWNLSGNPETYDYNNNFKRINAAGVIYNQVFYVFGGNPNIILGNLPYIFEYDLAGKQIIYTNDTLFSGENLPEQQMVANIGNSIYIFGGVRYGVLNKIYTFNTVDNKFDTVQINLKDPRAAGMAVKDEYSNSIYIIGGYNELKPALNSVEIFHYNGISYSIEQGPTLNYSRKDFSAVYCNGSIYLFGGYDESNNLVKYVEKLGVVVSVVSNLKPVNPDFKLYQNYPNPFNPSTKIQVKLKRESGVKLNIFSIDGRLVRNLINGEYAGGNYNFIWDGKDNTGKNVSSGVYLYSLESNGFVKTKKMLLLK